MQLKSDKKTRVLVVEDDAVVRVYTERVVTKGGYEVVSAPSGEDALKLLGEDRDIDIALTDIMMPGMSGFELLDAIKANPETAGIRVIMLTALNQVEDKVRAFSCGAADYISKPFESKELLARLGTQTRLKTAEESLRQSEEMFKSLVTNASDAITVTDIEGFIIFTNEASLAMMGIDDIQQVIGKDVNEYISPESRPHMMEARKSVLSNGVITNQEFMLKRPDDGLIPVEMTSSIIRDADGRPIQFISITRDISERRAVERAMRRRLDMEKILSDISTQFSGSSEEDVEQKILQALETVGRFVAVDHCRFIMLPHGARRQPYVLEWYQEGRPGGTISLEQISGDQFPWARSKLSRREALYVPSVESLPHEASVEKERWHSMGIHALIIIPLFFHDELVGTISVVWLEREHVWLDGDTRLLRLVGEIIVNALQRRQSEESIRHFNERLEGMHAIDHAILSAQSAQAIAFSALGHLQKLVPYDTAEVEYINLESGETEMLASQVGEDIQSGEARVSSSGLLDLPPALLQGNNHLVNDVNEHTLAYEIEKSLQSQGAASFLIAPLIFHEEFTGVLILTAEESDVFSDDRLLVVCEVADMLALGIKNALLFDEARETVEREMRLDEVTRIISGTLDVDIILKEVVRLSLELVNADASCFCLLSSDLKSVASSYQKGLPPEFEQIYRPHEWEVTRLSLCDKQSMIINDYFNQKEAIDLLLEQGVRRMMCVPVQASGMQMGVLLMFRMGNAKKFNTRDLWIIETVGRQAGAAIQNAMFYQSERHRVQELEAMSDIVADTLGELDLTMLLEAVVVRSVALLDTTGGELGLYDEKTKEIRVLVSFGLDQDYTNTRLAEGQGVMGHVAASHMPLMVREYQKSEGYTDIYRGLKNSAVLAVPLVARKKLLGVLAVVDSFPGRVFGPEDMHLLNLFGQQAAIAMENAMLYRSAQQRAIEAETLQQVAAVVASKLNLNEAIPTILEQLGKVIPYDSASVKLIHDGQLETVGGMGFPDLQAIMNIRFPVNGDGPNARVLRSGEPLIINDYRLEYEKFGTPPHDSVRSWLGVAMVFQKRNIGMLTLNSNEVNHFDEEHARMASAFADQVAIAIENARLFEEIQRLATTDPLTELYNRRHFFELSRGELERACRYKRQLSVMMLDIDRFKRINDRYGHLMGDHVLCIIAQRIRSSLRDIDITGRYGGEEFVILLPETGTQEAQEAAERLRRNIADTSVEIGESSESITVSVGVVTLDRQEKSVEIEKLFDRADQALYHAKQKGRNRVVVWSDSIPQNGHISGV